jgi:uncharacterized membrane protein
MNYDNKMNKQKREERFEKVVEWERKPNWLMVIILSIFILIMTFLLIHLVIVNNNNPNNLSSFEWFELVVYCCVHGGCGVLIILEFTDNERKVYWRGKEDEP